MGAAEFSGLLKHNLERSSAVFQQVIENDEFQQQFVKATEALLHAVRNKGIIFTCGNGGSFDDADHTVGELIGWYADTTRQRKALAVVPLGSSPGALTAIANDIGYDYVFSRQLEGFTTNGIANNSSVLFAFSTSGNSPNVMNAAKVAQASGIKVIAMTGGSGGKLVEHADIIIKVPSDITARIQEAHHVMYHTFCELIEKDCMKK